MTPDKALDGLMRWYLDHGNGEWEHEHGVWIKTLDNPGWEIGIDLEDTELESAEFPLAAVDSTETEWYVCRLEGKVFRGFCGPLLLSTVIDLFLGWAADVIKNGSPDAPKSIGE